MRVPVFLVWALVSFVLIGAIGGFVGVLDPCAEDGCPPTCGDCLACGLVAWVPAPPAVAPTVPAPTGLVELEAVAPIPPPRLVDHVPLLAS